MSQKIEITDDYVQKKVASGKQYCAFLYKAGPQQDQPEAEANQIQRDHLRYLFQLLAEEKLVINGPVVDDGELRGIGIFNLTDPEEVKKLLAADPAVRAGRLVYEVYSWFSIPGSCLPE